LTGLPNRRSFNESIVQRISEVARYGGELSFIILDVDHFKKFNDTYGHLLGDEVLKSVARVIRETVRDSDIPTRLGGEEFGVVMPSIGLVDACQAAERLRLAIERCAVHYEGQPLRVSASVGVTQVQAGDHPEFLIERADQALYAAKEGGRNAVWFWDLDQPRPFSKKRLAPSVPDAMQKNVTSLRDSLLAALDRS
jgi:diguanylate cyclase (GGDEF)-like protein